MISLGLASIRPRQQIDLGLHAPSAFANKDASSALAETAVWCSRKPSQTNKFRSPTLDPSALLEVPALEQIGIAAFVDAKRHSYQRATESIKRRRSELLRSACIPMASSATAEMKGRLLLYDPMETVSDGAAAASSSDFFDVEDAPPWDTWFWYAGGTIFCWVPELLVSKAQDGIDANPVDCIRWGDWSDLPARLEA
jgi:hypothetical protein